MADGTLVPAQRAHKHAILQPVSMTVTIRSKKNDQNGNGCPYVFTSAQSGDTYCYVSEMWAFATRARPQRKKPFFAIPAQDWTLKAPYLATHLKKLGAFFKLDTTRIGTHWRRFHTRGSRPHR